MTNSEARKRLIEAQGHAECPLSQPIPAPADSGAIGRLNEAERAVADLVRRVEHRRGLIADADWPEHLAIVIVHQCFANFLREHTDRALAEVEQRIDQCGVRNDSAERWGITTALHVVRDYRAARQEQGR